MATVADLINRIERDFLFPVGAKPATGRLAATITNSATTVTYSSTYWTQEELNGIGTGVLIEINSELFRVITHDQDTRTITVATRGTVEGTDAAAHTAGDEIYLGKIPTRIAIYEAVSDAVVDLFPDFFSVTTGAYTSSDNYIEVPLVCEDVLQYIYKVTESDTSSTRYIPGRVELLEGFTPSSTTKAIQLHGVPSGRTGYLRYISSFSRPTAETYDLGTNGVTVEWHQLLILDALITLVAATDLDDARVSYLTDTLRSQVNPTGEGESVSRMLIRLYEYRRQRAMRRMNANHAMTVEMNQIAGP